MPQYSERKYAGRGFSKSGQRSKRRAGSVSRRKALVGARTASVRKAVAVLAQKLGVEKKFFDSCGADVAIPSATNCVGGIIPSTSPAADTCLNSVGIGTGDSERDGRKITMKSIQVDGYVRRAEQNLKSAFLDAAEYTIALILNKQTNGAVTVTSDVFSNTAASLAMAPHAMRNLKSVTKYDILWKRTFKEPIQTTGNDAAGTFSIKGWTVPFKFYIPLRDLEVCFSADSALLASITDNSLMMYAMASKTGLQVCYNARLRYFG